MAVNDFPPIVTHMSTQVGKKNELNIVIPNTSRLYYDFAKEENPFLKDDRRFQNKTPSCVDHSILDKHITSIEKNQDSITLKLNTENIPYQVIRVVEDYNKDNQFIFDYSVGHGYVVNIEISLHNEGLADEMVVFEEVKYITKKYVTALLGLGYKTGLFDGDKFKNDKNVIINKIMMHNTSYTYSLTIHEKDVYKNYKKVKQEIEECNIDSKYKILNTILK
jgi:hypothetical protein